MRNTLKKYKLFIGTMLLLSVIIMTAFYSILKPAKVLPIYQPAQVNFELVDSTIQHQKNTILLPILSSLIKTVTASLKIFIRTKYMSPISFLPPVRRFAQS